MVTHTSSQSQSQSQSQSTTSATGAELIHEFRSELDALPDEKIVAPRVDVGTAVSTALGAMPEIERHRAALVRFFGDRATVALDRVGPTADLLLAAHAAYVADSDPDLEKRAQHLRITRDYLADTCQALIARGVVEERSLAKLEGGGSYHALFLDTLALAAWFQKQERKIASLSKVTAEELAAARIEARAFGAAVAERDKARAGSSDSARDRARAFTLFLRAYDTVAKMLTYLRWHEGDAEQIAPSLYGRSRSRRDANDEAPGTPAPNQPVPPGMPGGSPFQS